MDYGGDVENIPELERIDVVSKLFDVHKIISCLSELRFVRHVNLCISIGYMLYTCCVVAYSIVKAREECRRQSHQQQTCCLCVYRSKTSR